MPRTPTLLIISNLDMFDTFYNAAGYDKYDAVCVHSLWAEEKEIRRDTAGPLNATFVRRLAEKYSTNYDGVIIRNDCQDLIEPLRQGGYKGPIIAIKDWEDQIPDSKINPLVASMDKETLDQLTGRDVPGANASVGISPIDTFETRLGKTLSELIRS